MEIPEISSFMGTTSALIAMKWHESIIKPTLSLKAVGITHNTLVSWERAKLIERSTDEVKRRFSFQDYVFLHFIAELKRAGVPGSNIIAIRNKLFAPVAVSWLAQLFALHPEFYENIPDAKEKEVLRKHFKSDQMQNSEQSITLFQLILGKIMMERIPLSLMIFPDGNLMIWYEMQQESYGKEHIYKRTYVTYTSVSITQIIKGFIGNDKAVFKFPELPVLNQSETRLLKEIQSGEFESITVHFKDKKIKTLELTKRHDVHKDIVNILAENAYQDIEIKRFKGEVTKITNTVKLHYAY